MSEGEEEVQPPEKKDEKIEQEPEDPEEGEK